MIIGTEAQYHPHDLVQMVFQGGFFFPSPWGQGFTHKTQVSVITGVSVSHFNVSLKYFYPIVIITKIYLGYISDMAPLLRLRLLEISLRRPGLDYFIVQHRFSDSPAVSYMRAHETFRLVII